MKSERVRSVLKDCCTAHGRDTCVILMEDWEEHEMLSYGKDEHIQGSGKEVMHHSQKSVLHYGLWLVPDQTIWGLASLINVYFSTTLETMPQIGSWGFFLLLPWEMLTQGIFLTIKLGSFSRCSNEGKEAEAHLPFHHCQKNQNRLQCHTTCQQIQRCAHPGHGFLYTK